MSDTDASERLRHLEMENARLRRLLDRKGMPSTLRHQVRNTLVLLRAILRRSADGKDSVEDLVAHVEGRFDALLRVQTALLSSPDGCADLAALVSDELLAQAFVEGDGVTIEGPTARVEAHQAELLGLVLHELATNAVKFGSMRTSGARIDISWRMSPEHRLIMKWVESGQGHSDAIPSRRGFGLEAIEGMLPYQLKADGKVEFLPDGLRCTIQLPPAAERG